MHCITLYVEQFMWDNISTRLCLNCLCLLSHGSQIIVDRQASGAGLTFIITLNRQPFGPPLQPNISEHCSAHFSFWIGQFQDFTKLSLLPSEYC